MRRLGLMTAAAVLVLGLLSTFARAATVEVTISNFQFTPAQVTIDPGDTVRWTNNGPSSHTTSSDTGGVFDSGTLSPTGTFSFTFASSGTVAYHCNIHSSMHASVVVRTAAGPTFSISGLITGPAASGTSVSVAGAATRSTTTASNGTYSIAGLSAGAYTVHASRAGFAFTPPSTPVTLSADTTGVDFASTPAAAPADVLAVGKVRIKLVKKKMGRDSVTLSATFTPDPAAAFPDPSTGDALQITIGDFYDRTFAASDLVPTKKHNGFTFKDATAGLKLAVRTKSGVTTVAIALTVKSADFQHAVTVDPKAPHLVTVRFGAHEASATR